MVTQIIDVNISSQYAIERSCEILSSGGLILFPTETVYGIGCDLFNKNAAERIYKLKMRDNRKPLAAYIDKMDKAEQIAQNIPNSFYKLAEEFLPGPLTIILSAKSIIPTIINCGLDTIAIRIPANEFMMELLKGYEQPIAGTSANISGNPDNSDFCEALKPFEGQIELALKDQKSIKSGIASTLISLAFDEPIILREGIITKEAIELVINQKIKLANLL